jgi:hypothetical protein
MRLAGSSGTSAPTLFCGLPSGALETHQIEIQVLWSTRNARHAPEGHWADRPEPSLLVTHSDLGRVGSCFAAIDRPHPAIRQAGSA